MDNIHGVGSNFNLGQLLKTRELTKEVIGKVKDSVWIGMTELDGHNLINEELENVGVLKYWHPHKFRIGKNTTCSFREESDKDVILSENDIYFIDIGPVFDGYEGDFGHTFTIGKNNQYSEISNVVKEVFNETVSYWHENKCTGVELYNYASECANKRGYVLNKKMRGHRIGDFPHHIHYRGGLCDMGKYPLENLWVLEIHILDAEDRFGAFFEDIIL